MASKQYWKKLVASIAGGFLFCFLITYYKLSQYGSNIVRRIRLLNSSISTKNYTLVLSKQQIRPQKFAVPVKPIVSSNGFDFGGLELRFLEDESFRRHGRLIYHDYYEDTGYNELWDTTDDDGDIESYYAFDDDEKRNPYVTYDDPDIHLRKKCRRTKWHRESPITCNTIHEFDFQHHIRLGDTKFLGHGYFRQVYLSQIARNESIVFKMLNWNYNFAYDDFEYMRMDAIVNEKLNGYPQIVRSYQFCGNSIIGEAMPNGDLRKVAIPSGKRRVIKVNSDRDLRVMNSLSGTQKLKWSLEMAEAVMLLHGFPDGVIVHDDIQLTQFLVANNGKLKLNDFNRAEIMLWNEKDKEYCKYRNDVGRGDWRAPEEYYDKPLDEKIDIWSLGNNMYALLTGMYPHYDSTEKELQQKLKNGKTAYIDPRYKDRSFAEAKLAEIIPLCWAYDPIHRIDIFRLVDILRNAVHENKVYENTD